MPTSALRTSVIAARDLARADTLYPPFREVVIEVLRLMELMGWPMTLWEALRTTEQQFAHFRKGRKLEHGLWVPIDPVKRTGIVTNADGVEKRSNHQAKADGYGYAADCVFLVDGPDLDRDLDEPSWDDAHPWAVYGTLAEHLGGGKIHWLGRGPTLKDLVHIQWIG